MIKEYILKRDLIIKALIFLSIFSYTNIFYHPSDLKKIFCLISLFFLLNFYSEKKYFFRNIFYLIFISFIIYKSPYNYFFENGIVNLYTLFIPVFFIINIEKKKIKQYLFVIFIGIILCICFGFLNHISNFALLNIKISKKYFLSSFGNPNFLSNSLIIISLASFIFFNKKNKFSIINFLILINLFITLYIIKINSTRAAFIALFVYLLAYIYISLSRTYKVFMNIFILIMILIFIFFIKFNYKKIELNGSDINRILMYETGLNQIKDNYLSGSGIYKFQQEYPYYQSLILQNSLYRKYFTKSKNAAHIHNDFLELSGKTGILFSGIFIYILFFILYKSYLLEKKIIFCFFTSYIIMSILTFPSYISAILICLGLLSAYILNYEGKPSVKAKGINPVKIILSIIFIILVSLFSINNTYKKRILLNKEYKLDKNYIKQNFSCEVLGHFKEDRSFFEASLSKNEIRKTPYHNLGNYYLKKQEYIKAIYYYKQGLRLNPNYVEILNNIGQAYIYTHNFDRAVYIYKKALKANAFLEDLYNGISVAYANKKEYKKAIKYLEAGIKISGANPVMIKNLAVLYKQIGGDEKIIGLIKKEESRPDKRKNLLSFLKTLIVVK